MTEAMALPTQADPGDHLAFPTLQSPFTVRNLRLKNGIFMSGHMTMMVTNNAVNADQVAYYAARAEGGPTCGSVTEATAVHPTALRGGKVLAAAFRMTASKASPESSRPAPHTPAGLLGSCSVRAGNQASIRRLTGEVTYSASAVRTDRFHSVPREMGLDLRTT